MKSKVEQGVDLLSLFLENPEEFTEDLIIDELFDFFLAGSLTTQYASQTLISHCAKDPASLKRMRDEFVRVISQHPLAEKGNLSKREVMDAALDTELCGDLDYLNHVMCETLRF